MVRANGFRICTQLVRCGALEHEGAATITSKCVLKQHSSLSG